MGDTGHGTFWRRVESPRDRDRRFFLSDTVCTCGIGSIGALAQSHDGSANTRGSDEKFQTDLSSTNPPSSCPLQEKNTLQTYNAHRPYSFMKKLRKYKSHFKTRVKDMTGSDGGSRPSTPAPTKSGEPVYPALELDSSHSAPIATQSTQIATPRTLGRGEMPTGLPPTASPIEDVGQIALHSPPAMIRPSNANNSITTLRKNDGQVTDSSPPLDPEMTTTIDQQPLPYLPATAAIKETPVVLEILTRMKSEGWNHLKSLMEALNHATGAIGLGPLMSWSRKAGFETWPLRRGHATTRKRRTSSGGGRVLKMYQWATSQATGNIYWMSGMAGTGKTTIAHSLCEQLDDQSNRMLCASFFCSRSLPECRDVGRIIPSIAYQLAQFSRPFRYALSQVMEKDPLAHTRLPLMQFQSLIVEPISRDEVKQALLAAVVVVIDALDECEDVKSTKQILDVLLTKSKNLPIKFVVSSRPEPAIRDQMEKNNTCVDARVILHELDSRDVKADIKSYLMAELAPAKPLDSEIDRLAERAGVLFIYAATVVRYIGHDDFGRGRARLRVVLGIAEQQSKAQTEEIDQLYGTILESAVGDMKLEPIERDDIKLILDTVICAREPLTVAALSNLLRLDDIDRVQAAIRPLWSVLHVMEPSMTVSTLHASFPEYVLDPKRSGSWYCDAAARHQLLTQRCFNYIRDTKPQFNICQLGSSYLLDNEVADLDLRVQRFIPAELRYACLYWFYHLDATEAGAASDLKPRLSQFLTTRLLLWMEVRNLTKSATTTVSELTATKQWATRHDMASDVIDLLIDAWRLASTYVSNPVSQSTPHLYISMLPSLSASSPVCKHYSSLFRGKIAIEGTALDRRNDALLAQWKFKLSVSCMACSPDGTRLAIGGGNGLPHVDHIIVLDAFSGDIL